MTSSSPTSPDPDPSETPDLEPGGGVPPGDTPPIASTTSGTSYHDAKPSGKGGGRGYNITALVIVAIIVVAVLAFIIGKVAAG